MKILVLRAVLVSALLGLAACAAPQESVDAAEAEIGDANFSLASWNLEFFGSTTQGEVEDDALQVRNAATVIGRLNPDVIGLQEIVDSARWAELKSALPAYEGVLATDPIVEGDWSGARRSTSRPALLVKRDRVVVRGAKLVPEIDAYLPPMEVALSVEVGGQPVDLVVLVVHFYPSATKEAWEFRLATADRLKRYLDTQHAAHAVAVVGDFNDDVDESIYASEATPYAELRDDVARYRFTTDGLSVAGQGTTVSWPSTIDHHLVTNELADQFVPRSAWVERPRYIANYRYTTSDHYPVITRYALRP